MTSIIILSYNQLEYTKQCLESIRKYTENEEYEIIVIDNNSNDETVQWLKTQDDIIVQFNEINRGFPGGCNDGIKLAKEGSDILLLNNDIVVTKDWLTNLNKALYSSEDIGAVGPVTNSCSYWQQIDVNYGNIDDMQEFASKFNISNSSLWEQRAKLIGYCILIKREVVDKVGLLDEQFFPGNFEDDDYSMRIVLEGYNLLLCRDTFIHHFGSVSFKETPEHNMILNRNSQVFHDKWGFYSQIDLGFCQEYLSILEAEDNITVLDIYCNAGVNGLMLKFYKKNIEFYIAPSQIPSLKIASKFHKLYNYEDINFDYIIVNDAGQFLFDDNARKVADSALESSKNLVLIFNYISLLQVDVVIGLSKLMLDIGRKYNMEYKKHSINNGKLLVVVSKI